MPLIKHETLRRRIPVTRMSGGGGSVGTGTAQALIPGVWLFHIGRDSTANLDSIVTSKYVQYILFYTGNRHDSDWINSNPAHATLLEHGIAAVLASGKKSIIARNFWPTTSALYDSSILTSADYYAAEIAAIKALKVTYGADYTAFDIEAYGGAACPVEDYLSWADDYHPTAGVIAGVNAAIASAVAAQGQVDFVYPCGGVRTYSLFNLLDSLGVKGLLETTYYDKLVGVDNQIAGKDLKTVWWGIYLNTTKANPTIPENRYYLATEVPDLFVNHSTYGGLFMVPKEDKVTDVIADMMKLQ